MADIADQAQAVIDLAEFRARQQRELERESEFGDGTCRECGDAIQAERLRANAHALRCIDCQMDHERREAHLSNLYGE